MTNIGVVLLAAKNKTHVSTFQLLQWLFSFTASFRLKIFFLIGCSLGIAVSEIMIPHFFQYLIDTIRISSQLSLLYFGIVGICVAIGMQFLFKTRENILQREVGEGISRDIQTSAINHLRVLGFPFFEANSSGDILSLLDTDVKNIQNLYRTIYPGILQCAVILGVVGIGLTYISLSLTLMLWLCLILYFIVAAFMEKKRIQYSKRWMKGRTDLNRQIYEFITSLTEIRAFGREKWSMQKYMSYVHSFVKVWRTSVAITFLSVSLTQFFVQFGTCVIFLSGAYLIQNDLITLGQFVAYTIYFFIAINAVTKLNGLYAQQAGFQYNAARLYTFFNERPEVSEPAEAQAVSYIKGTIQMDGIEFGYPGHSPIIKDFHISLLPGEKVAIVGKSGNGKSTILKLLCRFYDHADGTLMIDGIDVRKWSLAQLRESIGYVFQETFLFSETIMENIRFGNPQAGDDEVIEASRQACCDGFITKLPLGYQTVIGDRGVNLSGGERQRIALARMFLKKPRIMLLDEATSALDNESEQLINKAINNMNVTTIAIAHRISTIKQFDKIAVMEDGRIVEWGSFQELCERKGSFHRLSQQQLSI